MFLYLHNLYLSNQTHVINIIVIKVILKEFIDV